MLVLTPHRWEPYISDGHEMWGDKEKVVNVDRRLVKAVHT